MADSASSGRTTEPRASAEVAVKSAALVMCLIAAAIAAGCMDTVRPLTVAERVSVATSTVSVSDTITTEGSVVLLTLQTRDAAGDSLTIGGLDVVFTATGGTGAGTISPTTDNGDGTYSASFDAVTPGSPTTIDATISGAPVTSALPTIEVTRAMADVSPGSRTTCALATNGETFCWGNNSAQFGDGTTTGSTTPVPGVSGLALRSVSTGWQHVCGTTEGGVAYCWGTGGSRLGSYVGTSTVPEPVYGGLNFQAVAAGFNHSCGVTVSGEAYCWGADFEGRLGDGNYYGFDSWTPAAVVGGLTFRMITAGGKHTCGVTTAGAAYCWGSNFHAQVGKGTPADSGSASPVPVAGGLSFQVVSAATGYHTCGVTTDGDIYCWGDNAFGQAGNGGTGGFIPAPVQVVGGRTWASVRAGLFHTCGVTTDGTAYCWGSNAYGQLGDGTTTNSSAGTGRG